jgi:hypothetical protein
LIEKKRLIVFVALTGTMGSCMSMNQDERKAKAHSDAIDREIQRVRREHAHTIKILLLGTTYDAKAEREVLSLCFVKVLASQARALLSNK